MFNDGARLSGSARKSNRVIAGLPTVPNDLLQRRLEAQQQATASDTLPKSARRLEHNRSGGSCPANADNNANAACVRPQLLSGFDCFAQCGIDLFSNAQEESVFPSGFETTIPSSRRVLFRSYIERGVNAAAQLVVGAAALSALPSYETQHPLLQLPAPPLFSFGNAALDMILSKSLVDELESSNAPLVAGGNHSGAGNQDRWCNEVAGLMGPVVDEKTIVGDRVGRIVELIGGPASGKSSVLARVVAAHAVRHIVWAMAHFHDACTRATDDEEGGGASTDVLNALKQCLSKDTPAAERCFANHALHTVFKSAGVGHGLSPACRVSLILPLAATTTNNIAFMEHCKHLAWEMFFSTTAARDTMELLHLSIIPCVVGNTSSPATTDNHDYKTSIEALFNAIFTDFAMHHMRVASVSSLGQLASLLKLWNLEHDDGRNDDSCGNMAELMLLDCMYTLLQQSQGLLTGEPTSGGVGDSSAHQWQTAAGDATNATSVGTMNANRAANLNYQSEVFDVVAALREYVMNGGGCGQQYRCVVTTNGLTSSKAAVGHQQQQLPSGEEQLNHHNQLGSSNTALPSSGLSAQVPPLLIPDAASHRQFSMKSVKAFGGSIWINVADIVVHLERPLPLTPPHQFTAEEHRTNDSELVLCSALRGVAPVRVAVLLNATKAASD